MSVDLMRAVELRGPSKRVLRQLLGAIAFNADDYGFAAPAVTMLAAKMPCDVRTVLRQIAQLERDGWVTVHRDVLHGKASVYLVNLGRLAYQMNAAKARRGEWWPEAKRKLEARGVLAVPVSSTKQDSPDEDAVGNAAENPFLRKMSRDKTGGVHVTNGGGSHDKNVIPIRKNEERGTTKDKDPLPPSPEAPLRKTAWGIKTQEQERATANATATAQVRESGTSTNRTAVEHEHPVQRQAERVLIECGLSNGRMRRVVAGAMRVELDRRAEAARRGEREAVCDVDAEAAMVATAMCANWREFQRAASALRFTVGPRKFFEQGMAMGRCWPPVDHDRMRMSQRLAVGT